MTDRTGLEDLSDGERDFAIEVFGLARAKLVARKAIAMRLVEFSVVKHTEFLADELVFSITAQLAEARSVATIDQEAVPTTWWQHLRKSLGLRRWKGRQVATHVEIRHVCPHFSDCGEHAHVRWIEDRSRREAADLQEVAHR